MRKPVLRFLLTTAVAALVMALSASAFAQGVTTSGINGFVTDKSGKPVDGALITVLHEPSGTRAVTSTRPTGRYNLAGLRVGGPYTVSVEAKEFQPQSEKGIFLSTSQDQTVNFVVSSDVVEMEAFVVFETRETTFDTARMGANTTFGARQVNDVPTIRRDVQDLANMDSRLSLTENTTQVEFAVSAQGQNSRFNSFLIDGVQSNDPFGLNANGFASLRSPVPLSALESISFDFEPYDVKYTGFTGVLINAVIKSGTNDFHGSLYGSYTGRSPFLRARNPVTGLHDQLQERTQAASFSGPIIKNKLFFYLYWESFRRVQAAPGQVFVPDASTAALIAATARSFGYDPGAIGATDAVSEQKTCIAKLDWNINGRQRATFTYRRTDSATPNFADFNYTTATSYSNHWYQARRVHDVFGVQLNSQWTPDFQTEAAAQYFKYNGTAAPNGAPFPEIYINGVTGTRLDNNTTVTNGQLDLGTNYSYQLNNLFTKDYHGHLYGDYSWGDHTFKFGGDTDKNQYDDRFVQYYFGRYGFASPAAFVAETPNYLRYQQAAPGYTLPQGYACYSMTDFGLVAQDTWKPGKDLTVLAGLRFDYPWFPERPPFNGNFYNAFGFRNNTTASGNYTIAPRLGINYDLPEPVLPGLLGGRRTQIRGGVGLFRGTNPAVWVANSYQTAGVLNSVTYGASASSNTNAPITQLTEPAFHPDPNYVQTLPPPSTPTAVINVTDPNFKTPTSWKGNLAIDHTLPWLGLVATAEADVIRVEEGIDYKSLNINPAGTLPDGRTRYGGNRFSNFAQVLDLTNTTKGGSQAYTFGIDRPMKNQWSFSVFYTHTHATEVQPLTSSVANSNFNYRATVDPNAGTAWGSAYNIPDRLIVKATREFNLFSRTNAETRITATFRLQTGHAYSWVFNNDVNGDAGPYDAFYVPTPDDSKVVWSAGTGSAAFASAQAAHDAFFTWLAGTDLRKNMGRIAPPNSSFNPEQQTVDLHIEQRIPFPRYEKARLSIYLDCLNFANLLNSHWGAVTGLDFGTGFNGYNRNTGVTATYNSTTNQYIYTFVPGSVSAQPPFTDLSRWQAQIGAKLEF
jgi:hypothetical protein